MATTQKPVHQTREAWLCAARDILAAERFAPAGVDLSRYRMRVSVGFPLGGRRAAALRIGECHFEARSKDGTRELFISPELANPLGPCGVLLVLTHELLHAALPSGTGHRGKFVSGMRKLGLEGKPTSTIAGKDLAAWFEVDVLPRLGGYPHAALARPPGKGGQRNRHRKYVCPGCSQIIRAASSTLNAVCGDCDERFELAD